MGVEMAAPLLSDQVLAYNFTNEGGVGGTIRLLKNIMGLWLVQECRRAWERPGKTYTYDELMQLAEAAPPFVEPRRSRRSVLHPAAEHAARAGRFLPQHRPAGSRRRRRDRCAAPWRAWPCAIAGCWSGWRN